METNKCPQCGAALGANAPEGLCPRCLMSQGLDEASQEHKPRRSPAMNNDRNLLFGVLAVQLRKVTPVQLMDIAGGWAMDPSRSLQDRLVEAGVISKEDCEFVNDVVDRAIQSYGGDPSATLNSFGGDEQIYQSFAGSVVRTPDGEISSGRGPAALSGKDEMERLDAVEEIPGRYTHISEYSHGGMGRILLVHDQHLGRDIAMKELLPTSGSAQDSDGQQSPVRQAMPLIARFLQEARITGQLEHPAIVPVYELGRRKDGTLYYTMKLVRGETLSHALKSCKSLDDRIKLLPHFLDLCQAMAYAHSLGVIHRDIKPANVMVGQFGETVVIDWGLAKAKGKEDIHAKEMEKTMLALRLGKDSDGVHTAYGEAMGTPTYMPPEQAEGKLDIVNERSDVYSLGAVLYEILTGHVPFSGKNVYAILKKVLEEQPASIQSITPDAPPELAAICQRAMSKDVNDRYANAKELAEEIKRFLSGALVQGYRYGMRELLGRFVRRHKAILATAAAAVILLLVGGVASYVQIMQERDRAIEAGQKETLARQEEVKAREQAENAKVESENRRQEAEAAKQESEIRRQEAETAKEESEMRRQETQDALAAAEQQSYQAKLLLADAQISKGEYSQSTDTLENAPVKNRNWEWAYLRTLSETGPVQLPDPNNVKYPLVQSPDGRYVFSTLGESTNGCVLYDATTRKTQVKEDISKEQITAAVFSPDSKRLLTGDFDGAIDIREVTSFNAICSLVGHTDSIFDAVFSPDGHLVATASLDGTARLWQADTGTEVLQFAVNGHPALKLKFSPDGTQLAIGGEGFPVTVYNINTGKAVYSVKGGWPFAFSPDGSLLATSTSLPVAKNERLKDLAKFIINPECSPTEDSLCDPVSVDFTDLDMTMAVAKLALECNVNIIAGTDLKGVVTYGASDKPIGQVLDEVLALGNLGIYPEGGVFLITPQEEAKRQRRLLSVPHFLPWRSKLVPAVSSLGYDVEHNPIFQKVDLDFRSKDMWEAVSFLADKAKIDLYQGIRVYGEITLYFREVPLWSALNHILRMNGYGVLESKGAFRIVPYEEAVSTPLKNYLLEQSKPVTCPVFIWNANTGSPKTELDGHQGAVFDLAFTKDGSTLATVSADHTVRLWNINDNSAQRVFAGHSDSAHGLTFSPDGRYLATYSLDNKINVWNFLTGRNIGQYTGHNALPVSVRFSPDGRTVVSVSEDNIVHTWDTFTQSSILSRTCALPYKGRVESISADLQYVLITGEENVIMYDVVRHHEVSQLNQKDKASEKSLLSLDARIAATCSYDINRNDDGFNTTIGEGSIVIWETETGREIAAFPRKRENTISSWQFSPDGKYLLISNRESRLLTVWDVNTGELKYSHKTGPYGKPEMCGFCDIGQHVIWREEDNLHIWNLETNQVITGTPPEGVMPKMDLSVTHWWYPTGKNNEEYSQNDYLFSALDMMAYRIFERLSLKNDDIYMYVNSLLCKLLGSVSYGDGIVVTLYPYSPSYKWVLKQADGILVARNAKDDRIATATIDGKVHLWALSETTKLITIDAGAGPLKALQFGQDGMSLMAIDALNVVRRWTVPDWQNFNGDEVTRLFTKRFEEITE